MVTLIAEDLLLLMLDDRKGTFTSTSSPQPVLGGAVLIELALLGAVDVEPKPNIWKSAKVHAIPGPRPEDPTLGSAYDVVAEKPRSAEDLVNRLGKNRRDELAERLVVRGFLERRDTKVLGVFPSKRWPSADASREEKVRRDLTAVLVQGVQPDARTAALVALLAAIDKAHRMVDHEGLSKKVVRKRAKEIAEGAWAAKAVKDAISAATAAVATVAVAGAVGASSGS